MEILGIRFVGINEENGQKLLLTVLFIVGILFLKWLAAKILSVAYSGRPDNIRLRFWARQGLGLASALIIVLVFLSIWFDDPTRLTTGLGLVTAGLAFALQKVVTSFAGYLVIMRGKTFSVGERITMGGIRGDVISLGFLQTTIMEMGQPPSVQGAVPAMWVRARQFTGRIVTVTNDKIFENPVYNYTRDFPFIWEEMSFPIKYETDRGLAERIITEVVARHTEDALSLSAPMRENLEKSYGVRTDDMLPRVFYRLTDNWLELTVRFIVSEHGIRDTKDLISRELLDAFDEAGITLASQTQDIVGFPPVKVELSASESFLRNSPAAIGTQAH